LAPVAAAVEGTQSPPHHDPVKVNLEYMRNQAAEAAEDYAGKLQEWIAATEQQLPPETESDRFVAGTERVRQSDYHKLQARYESEMEALEIIREHAAALFGNDAPFYVPPVVVLRRSVERLRE
jgi:hypothetical protein